MELNAIVGQLEGVAAAIVYDGKIDDTELALLVTWLRRNERHAHEEPIAKLFRIVNRLVEVGHVRESERRKLLEFLMNVAAIEPACELFDDVEAPAIDVRGRAFVFAISTMCPRACGLASARIVQLGGGVHSDVEGADYVVVGPRGPKVTGLLPGDVERAIERRRRVGEPRIIREYALAMRLMGG